MEIIRVMRGNSVYRIKNALYNKFAGLEKINNDDPINEIIRVIIIYIMCFCIIANQFLLIKLIFLVEKFRSYKNSIVDSRRDQT